MIDKRELRLGNLVYSPVSIGHHPAGNILVTSISADGINVWCDHGADGWGKFQYLEGIPLTAEWLERCGFIKSIEQPLLPISEDWSLTLPVKGGNSNEIWACIINDKDPYKDQDDLKSYARASVNDYHASNNMYFVHQLQNLFFALTGKELEIQTPITP